MKYRSEKKDKQAAATFLPRKEADSAIASRNAERLWRRSSLIRAWIQNFRIALQARPKY
jgi:hypothetical protein